MKTTLVLLALLLVPSAFAGPYDGPQPLPVPKIGNCPHGWLTSGGFCVPSGSRQDAIPKSASQNCPWGWLASGAYCLRSGGR